MNGWCKASKSGWFIYIIALLTLDTADMQHVFMDIFWSILGEIEYVILIKIREYH